MKFIENSKLQHIWNGKEFWNHEPIQIEKEEIRELKDHDVMILRYAAMMLLAGNEDNEVNEDSMEGIEESSAICDDRLYVGDFEGIWMDDNITLQYFYMHKNNRICAATYDSEKDDFQYWLIY